ncbi:MAG: hypothetical protein E6248_16430 [Clostridium sp.]|uniref:hypothetical protein n=1 Tax=Clostridium sp. TaxID=1506 RepID=UPI00290F5A46|nr:hypothetical protein [Clostridium sp.]MDU5112017.1 hypothetical protein [Clostridium sp.]
MIFKAIIIPTPKRIKKYFEEAMMEFNTSSLKKEEDKELKHINLSKDSFKSYGISMKIF